MTLPPIYVLRHGETEWNAQNRMQGALNSPLTEQGRRQAEAQGEALAFSLSLNDLEVRVSPQGRAFETAAIALSRRVTHLVTDERLREIDVGVWSGRLRSELTAVGEVTVETPDGPLALYEHAPGGEGFERLRLRCEAFLGSLTGPTICVTHGITSRMLRAVALGVPTSGLGDLPGGQGVVYAIEDGVQRKLPSPS